MVPKNDFERNNDEEEETEEEEEHVVGFIIIVFTRRQTKCYVCVFLCGNSENIQKPAQYSKDSGQFSLFVVVLKMQDEQREECSCSY